MTEMKTVEPDSIDTDLNPVLQWVTFQLASEVYCVNVMQVREVLRYTNIAPVPGSPNYVLGIINLRGNVVTVIDLRIRFGLSENEITDSTRIIIIETETQVVGILVDSVAEVVYLRQSEIDLPPSTRLASEDHSRFIQGIAHYDSRLLILVDLNQLLSKDEWETIPT